MRSALAGIVILAGCNQVYGLDRTTARDAFEPILDDDKDGIADDGGDNCLGVANPGQQDADEDGKGDACDTCAFCAPCAIGPEHDEDGDRIADGCDNCPAVANATQTNIDADDVGDDCDPDNASVHRRVFFDGFQTLDPAWLPAGAPWNASNDGVEPGLATANEVTLEHAMVRITSGTTWFVEVGMSRLPELTAGVGVASAMAPSQRCTLEDVGAYYRLNNSGITDTMQLQPQAPLRLRYRAAGPLNNQDPVCDLVGIHSRPQGIVYQLGYPLRVQLIATGAARFTYVDVISP